MGSVCVNVEADVPVGEVSNLLDMVGEMSNSRWQCVNYQT